MLCPCEMVFYFESILGYVYIVVVVDVVVVACLTISYMHRLLRFVKKCRY